MALNYQQTLTFLLAMTNSEISCLYDQAWPNGSNRSWIYAARNTRQAARGQMSINTGQFTRAGFQQIGALTIDNNIILNDLPHYDRTGNQQPFDPRPGVVKAGLYDYELSDKNGTIIIWVPSSMNATKIRNYVQAVARNNKNYNNPKYMPIPEGKKQYPAQGYFNDFYHVRTPTY